MTSSTGPYVPPTHTCKFMIPLLGDAEKVCGASSVYQIEIHEYRKRARMAYPCSAHLGATINALRGETKQFQANLPRWVVTPLTKSVR